LELLYILLILLVVTRACGEVAERINQPPLAGELVGGIFLGLLVSLFPDRLSSLSGLHHDPTFTAITDLAIFFLMLQAGIELNPRKIANASLKAFLVALGGFGLPLISGLFIGWVFLPESALKLPQALFIGTALAITAIPIAVKALMDLGKLDTPVGHMIVSAAIFDDVMSLILLAILLSMINTGGLPEATDVGILGLKVGGFFAITIILGQYVFPVLGKALLKAKASEFELSALLVMALAYSVLAEVMGLHFVLGAFLAGLFFRQRTTNQSIFKDITNKIGGLTSGFLAPVFFASIGLSLDPGAIVAVPGFVLLLLLVAFLGKLIGAGGVARAGGMSGRDALAVGAAMSGRGAVELILAGIALRAGLFEVPDPPTPIVENLFSTIVIVAIVTTVAMPIILRQLLGRK